MSSGMTWGPCFVVGKSEKHVATIRLNKKDGMGNVVGNGGLYIDVETGEITLYGTQSDISTIALEMLQTISPATFGHLSVQSWPMAAERVSLPNQTNALFYVGQAWASMEHGSQIDPPSTGLEYGLREDIDTAVLAWAIALDPKKTFQYLKPESWRSKADAIERVLGCLREQVYGDDLDITGIGFHHRREGESLTRYLSDLTSDPFMEQPGGSAYGSAWWLVDSCTGQPRMRDELLADEAFQAAWVAEVAKLVHETGVTVR